MWKRTVLQCGALVAALLLAVLVDAAPARRIETNREEFKIVWPATEKLEIRTEAGEMVQASIRCPITLEGSFHSLTISKVARENVIGYITRARSPQLFTSCEATNAVSFSWLAPFPWRVFYSSFGGILPTITRVIVETELDFIFTTSIGSANCLYAATPETGLASFSIELNGVGKVTGLHAKVERPISRNMGGGFCPARMVIERTGTFTHPSGLEINFRLVQ